MFGNEILFDEDGGVDNIQIIRADKDTLVLCYKKFGAGECRLAAIEQIAGSSEMTVVISTEKFDFQFNSIESPTIFRVPANSLLPNENNPELLGVCYVDENNGVCKFGEIDLNAFKINFDETYTKPFADRGCGEINAIYLEEFATLSLQDRRHCLIEDFVNMVPSLTERARTDCFFSVLTFVVISSKFFQCECGSNGSLE